MEWIAFIFAIIAITIASDSEARAMRLARRVAALEAELAKPRPENQGTGS